MFPRRSLPLLALMMVGGVSSVNDANCSYTRLLEHLNLLNDNVALSDVRPVVNWTTPLEVRVDMYVYRILEVDQTAQTFSFRTWDRMVWRNEFLTWNTSDFCGIDRLAVPREKLWRPDILIREDISGTSNMMTGPYMHVDHNGSVTEYHARRLTVTCGMDLYNFPFDRQSCNISFMSLTHDDQGIVLRPDKSSNRLNKFAKNANEVWMGEWMLLSINYTTALVPWTRIKHQIVYTVTFKRRPLLYVINLLLPLLFFLVLDVASFFISGEKLDFKITILLSISVLLLILNDILPSTDYKLPLIALYCIVVFVLVGLSLLETMLVVCLTDLDSRVCRDPQTTRHIGSQTQRSASTSGKAGQGEINCQSGSEIGGQVERADRGLEAEASPGKRAPDGVRLSLSDPRVLELVLEEVRRVRLEGSSAAGGGDQGKPGYWERVARRIDIAYFCLYLLTTIGFSVYMIVVWVI